MKVNKEEWTYYLDEIWRSAEKVRRYWNTMGAGDINDEMENIKTKTEILLGDIKEG